ncbi:MAG: OsmC family peroxiredoxin [Solirubrobacterales bacterium]
MTLGENGYTGDYNFSSRFEEGDGTNPEELIAAALAGCFSMALANDLAQHGHPAESIATTAKASIRQIDEMPTIARIELETEGRVDGIDEAHFIEHAEKIKQVCIISRALGGVPEIELTSTKLL